LMRQRSLDTEISIAYSKNSFAKRVPLKEKSRGNN
jgi:hypothetical protein